MDLYNVVTCKFIEVENHVYVERLIVDEYVNHICVIDSEGMIATDIRTGDSFYILKKDKKGRIKYEESSKIRFNEDYGTSVSKLNMKLLSKRDQLKVYLEYCRFVLLQSKKPKQKVKR